MPEYSYIANMGFAHIVQTYYMIKRSSFLLSFILLCLCLESSLARWGNEKDAPIEVTLYNREIIVHENGTAKEQIEIKIKILNEAGRSGYSSYRLSYNHD